MTKQVVGTNGLRIGEVYGTWHVMNEEESVASCESHGEAKRACAAIQVNIDGMPQDMVVWLDFETDEFHVSLPEYVPEWPEIRIGTIQEILNVTS